MQTTTPAPKKKKRDPGIEMLRFVASWLVITAHMGFPSDGSGKAFLLLEYLTTNVVPLFYAITGCFWFRGKKTWGKACINHLRTVILPLAVSVIMLEAFAVWFRSTSFTLDGVYIAMPDWVGLIRGLLKLDYTQWSPWSSHLWYVVDFTTLLLWFPIMQILIQHGNSKLNWTIIGLTFLATGIQDAGFVLPGIVSQWFPSPILGLRLELVFMLIGHEMYKLRDEWQKRPWLAILSVLVIAVLTYARDFLQAKAAAWGNMGLFNTSNTCLQIPLLIAFFIFALSIHFPEWLANIFRFLSEGSYYVYLIHAAVICKFGMMKFPGTFWWTFAREGGIPGWVFGKLLLGLCGYMFSLLLCLPFLYGKKVPQWIRAIKARKA